MVTKIATATATKTKATLLDMFPFKKCRILSGMREDDNFFKIIFDRQFCPLVTISVLF